MVYKSRTELAREKNRFHQIIELNLCEQEALILKPNILYRFVVDPTCKRCMELSESLSHCNPQENEVNGDAV